MKIKPNISFTFNSEMIESYRPGVKSVCCYPLKKGGMGSSIPRTNWALEYHSKYAGELRLKNAPGKPKKRERRTIHIYAPGCAYMENTLNADLPVQETYIVFQGGDHSVLSKLIDPKLLCAIIHVENDEAEDLFMKAVKHCDTYGERAFWKVQGVFMEIMHLLSLATRDGNGDWRISEANLAITSSFSEKVENYLRKNIDRKLQTSDIASYMKVSESSLNHKYKEETGRAPIAKFIEIRIDFAKSLLLKGEKLKVIAEMTGFHDEYHLSKAFKKITGSSPREYKNSFAKDL